jgi:hypothetical protein
MKHPWHTYGGFVSAISERGMTQTSHHHSYNSHHNNMKLNTSMFGLGEQAITHFRGCRGDSKRYSTLQG